MTRRRSAGAKGTDRSRVPARTSGLAAVLWLVLLMGCGSDTDAHASDRGGGLPVATLSSAAQASVYAAALRGAFDLGPDLVLLADTAVLPRVRGAPSPHALSTEVVRRLRAAAVIQGTCTPRAGGPHVAPICAARRPGYVVRFSDVFQMAPDTVRLYVTADRFRASRDSMSAASLLHFEQRYDLARRRATWRVTTKARLVQ